VKTTFFNPNLSFKAFKGSTDWIVEQLGFAIIFYFE